MMLPRTVRRLLVGVGVAGVIALVGLHLAAWTGGPCQAGERVLVSHRLACGLHLCGGIVYWMGMMGLIVLSAGLFLSSRTPALSLVGLAVFLIIAAYGFVIYFSPTSAGQLQVQYLVGKRHFSGASLRDVDLRGANLKGAHLCQANLAGADLREADLSGADLRRVRLQEADLRGADLCGANLSRALLAGARVTDEQLARAASLRGATLPDGTVNE